MSLRSIAISRNFRHTAMRRIERGVLGLLRVRDHFRGSAEPVLMTPGTAAGAVRIPEPVGAGALTNSF